MRKDDNLMYIFAPGEPCKGYKDEKVPSAVI